MNVKLNGNETVFLEMSESGQLQVVNSHNINRGFLFGDGLFETMIYINGKIRFKEAHNTRLQEGCKLLKMDLGNPGILDNCEAFFKKNIQVEKGIRVRYNIYREGMGKYSPESNQTSHLFMIQNHQSNFPAIRQAYIELHIKVPSLPWSNCKTLNALVYVMANLERQRKNMDEVILLNHEGHICEAGAANLFWVKDSIFYTPSLSANCIAGIGRKAIIEELKSRNIELVQGGFKPKDFLSADQVITSNVTGINYISKVDMREFDTSPIPFLEQLFMVED